MEVFVLICLLTIISLWFIPNDYSEEINKNNYKLDHCDIHKWISRPTGLEDNSNYTQCAICGYCPESGSYH